MSIRYHRKLCSDTYVFFLVFFFGSCVDLIVLTYIAILRGSGIQPPSLEQNEVDNEMSSQCTSGRGFGVHAQSRCAAASQTNRAFPPLPPSSPCPTPRRSRKLSQCRSYIRIHGRILMAVTLFFFLANFHLWTLTRTE